ncbi:MAG TPA: sigma-70 family RNA polymerase sigma factor [Gemmatimonadaceae bacterium]
MTPRHDPAFQDTVTQHAFDPSAFAQREEHLGRRLSIAVARIGDAAIVDRVRRPLTEGTSAEVFRLLGDDDRRISNAAHECAMLRFAFIVAIVAQSMSFDADRRDDLVQRVFLNLPQIVRRATINGVGIPDPEGWLAYRAHLIARQMFREERGRLRPEASGGFSRTRGRRVALDAVDQSIRVEADSILDPLDESATRDEIAEALRLLSREQPVWADVLRLHYLDGLRLDEVAVKLGRAHGTVRNDAQKARARLAALLRRERWTSR